jgi:hypothetical protein
MFERAYNPTAAADWDNAEIFDDFMAWHARLNRATRVLALRSGGNG